MTKQRRGHNHIKPSLILLLLRIFSKDSDELYLYLILILGHIKHQTWLSCALETEDTYYLSLCNFTAARPVPWKLAGHMVIG